MKKQKRNSPIAKKPERKNDMSNPGDLLAGVFSNGQYGTSPLSFPFQLSMDNAYTPLTLNRILLSYSYMTHGIIQTMIDQPIEDAFRGGLKFQCDEMDADDLKILNDYWNAFCMSPVKDVMRWAKLYGGAGLIINTDQDPTKEIDIDAINQDSPLSFFAADRWELIMQYLLSDEKIPCPYNYYGQRIHRTRVVRVLGKEPPSYIRKRLQGWGMSEVERTIRPLNAYVKNEDLVYELLDEAKIDVWKIENFNTQILSKIAQGQISTRLQLANLIKNFHRAIVMDKEDEFEQKQIAFAGLPEILRENRIGAAAAVRMPMTKLFGLSAAGFNSGEDDIENYNALVESEVRAKAREVVMEILPLVCRQLFGYIPDSLDFEFNPLRVLSTEQEENIKNMKFNRFSTLYSQGMLTPQEYAELLKHENIINIETEVMKGHEPTPPPAAPTFTGPTDAVSESSPKEGL